MNRDATGIPRLACAISALLFVLVVAPAHGQDEPDAESDASDAAPILTWPRSFVTDGGETVVYQPQIDEWADFAVLRARSAIVVTPEDADQSQYGMIAMEARTRIDYEAREVLLDRLMVTDVRFPGIDDADTAPLVKLVHASMPLGASLTTSLDRVIAAVERSQRPARQIDLNLDPPPIYFSPEPAVLVMFMGEPRFEEVAEGSGLFFAVNTNWDLFLDGASSRYFLLSGTTWLTTDDLKAGAWVGTTFLPTTFMKLPDDENWTAAREHIPPRGDLTAARRVFVTTEPAELILTDGAPQFTPIPGTKLLAVANTESDLFRHTVDNAHYLLVAGRWFRAASLDGPWSAATTNLPADFAMIPEDDPYARVLASVPGTPDADAAVLLASVPRKATVKRSEVKIDVVYEGDPVFRAIEETTVLVALNTAYDVFKVDQAYYCCHQSVWFAATSPHGPWVVWDDVPDAIYQIPPSSPKHNVTYVRVYVSTPETVVVGHTSGYTGEFVAGVGLVMFGLGYALGHNDDWDDHWHYHHYHYHQPHYYSYGCAARYDYYHGGYYRSARAYGPYGGAGRAAAYNPATGTYARGAYRYGPRGGVAAYQAYNPYTDRYVARAGASGPYGSWGRSVVAEGNDWVRTGHRSGPGGRAAGFETSRGAAGIAVNPAGPGRAYAVRDKHGDLYVGREGNVHRRSSSGSWETRRGRSWAAEETPARDRVAKPERARGTPSDDRTTNRTAGRQAGGRSDDLDRARQARKRGDQRTQRAHSSSRGAQRSSGGRTGGRSRGGGRRR